MVCLGVLDPSHLSMVLAGVIQQIPHLNQILRCFPAQVTDRQRFLRLRRVPTRLLAQRVLGPRLQFFFKLS